MAEQQGDQVPPPRWTEEQVKRRRQRAVVMAWALGALVTLFFVITIVKLGGNVANRTF